MARSIPGESWKAPALSGIAKALVATDPDRAARLFTDAERIARSIAVESSKAYALMNIAEAVAATDPDRAAQLFTDASRIARNLDEYGGSVRADQHRGGAGSR